MIYPIDPEQQMHSLAFFISWTLPLWQPPFLTCHEINGAKRRPETRRNDSYSVGFYSQAQIQSLLVRLESSSAFISLTTGQGPVYWIARAFIS